MDSATANLNDRKALAHRIRTETEGMLCDQPDCTSFATHAVVPTDTRSGDDTLDVDLACDTHRHTIEQATGFHVETDPLSPDVAAVHALLRH